jgi:Leucine-rich repeat (LRR) protein
LIPSKQINFLNLETNEINELNDLEVLTSLSELEILIVRDNPVAEINNYRERLFNSLTSLKAVDCYNRDDNFISSDGEDSYITDKYHSWRNLEDITPEK